MNGLNLAALLAAPRVLATANGLPPVEHLLQHLDAFAEVLSGPGSSSRHIGAHACREALRDLRAACLDWTSGTEAPPDVVRTARALLSAAGVGPPAEGWDEWSGPNRETGSEPEDPDPPRLATGAQLTAPLDGWRLIAATEWCRYIASSAIVGRTAPALLRHSALAHVDALLQALRPLQSNDDATRRRQLARVAHLEGMRAECEEWNEDTAPPLRLQESARALLLSINAASTMEECEAFDGEVEQAFLAGARS